jgi:hypothetical protein
LPDVREESVHFFRGGFSEGQRRVCGVELLGTQRLAEPAQARDGGYTTKRFEARRTKVVKVTDQYFKNEILQRKSVIIVVELDVLKQQARSGQLYHDFLWIGHVSSFPYDTCKRKREPPSPSKPLQLGLCAVPMLL